MSASFADELLDDLGDEEAGEELGGLETQQGEALDADEEQDRMEDDLAGLGDEDGEDDDGDEAGATKQTPLNPNAVRPADELHQEDVNGMDLRPGAVDNIESVCTLLRSKRVQNALASIAYYIALEKPDIDGVLEDSPEYQLIVSANNIAVDVDNEIMVAHKFIRQHYQPRFPELESLIPNPWEFVQAVQAIGNNSDNLAKAKLDGILPPGTVVVISMQAATTKGRKLSAEAWTRVEQACKMVFDLEEARRTILQYVESRMTVIAPNLSKVVGSRVATKLLGIAGGLTALTKVPACNLMLLGANNKVAPGMSTAFSGRHRGFIVQAPLVENTPDEYQRQALRIVSAKATLAARVDAGGSDRHGVYGAKLVQELERKLEKLQEPPPAKMVKALPVPKEGGNKNRRGGRRARKMKERNGMSDLRKMQNRVRFGEAEEEVGAFEEVGLGMLSSKGDSGRLRAQAANNGTKAQMSKRNTQRIQAIQQGSAASRLDAYSGLASAGNVSRGEASSSGTQSSLSFTPVQGIELIDPSRQRKVDEANAKWFKEGMFSLAPGAGSRTTLPGSIATQTDASSKRQKLGQ